MSDFERELREAKRRALEDAKKQELIAAAQERQEILDEEQRRLQKIRDGKMLFERRVRPLKSMVDRLMEDLGNETWGRGKFEHAFWPKEDVDFAFLSENKQSIHIARWTIGRVSRIHSPAWPSYRNTYTWHATLETGKGWSETEYFLIALKLERDTTYFASGHDDRTNGNSEAELKELLKRKFLKGSQHNYHTLPDNYLRGGAG